MIYPHLSRIDLYPIKALDGVNVSQATVLKSGALMRDREYAFFDDKGHFINGKRNAKVHRLRSALEDDFKTLSLRIQNTDQQAVFDLDKNRTALETWLSDYFGLTVRLQQNTIMGFPDDTDSPGPTVISTATLETIAAWFPGLSLEEVRKRFRTNLEIDGAPPFWEDRLFAEADQTVQFQIGEVTLAGVNPCRRCVVPTRDPQTGEAIPNFQKTFIRQRSDTLPDWTVRSRFKHYYRLAVNTRLPESQAGKILSVGDKVGLM